MAIPNTGTLKLWDTIWNSELQGTKGENSLHSASVYAEFTTPDAMSDFYGWSDIEVPTVTTNAMTSITHQSMTANGNVTQDGNDPAVTRGFYFGTSNSYTSNTKYTTPGSGPGPYSQGFGSLTYNTNYKGRSWAATPAGECVATNQCQATTPYPPFTPQYYQTSRYRWCVCNSRSQTEIFFQYINPYSGQSVTVCTAGNDPAPQNPHQKYDTYQITSKNARNKLLANSNYAQACTNLAFSCCVYNRSITHTNPSVWNFIGSKSNNCRLCFWANTSQVGQYADLRFCGS